MKKALVIVAMLLLVTPVMATTTISAVQGTQFTASDGNKVQPISITYTSTVDVRAFALDINIDSDGNSPNFQGIRGFKTGESTAASPGYGIFPSRFRDFIQVLNGTDVNTSNGHGWVDPNYNPTTSWNEPGTTSHTWGMGFPQMVVEMGTLYAGDANKPATTGTLFTFDVNAWGKTGTFHVTIAADTLRGGVVNSDGNTITASYVGTDVVFAGLCTVPNVVNETEAQATADIVTAGFTLGTRTTTCSPTVASGSVISTNPASGAQPGCGTAVAYVVSTGLCCITIPTIINDIETDANSAITGAGFVGGIGITYANSNTVVYGHVISQDTGCVAASTKINYVVSAGCFPMGNTAYSDWVSLSKPTCWCYPRQCHGDADGKEQGSVKGGYQYVSTNDLAVLVGAWNVYEPTKGPGIASITVNGIPGICADFVHDAQGSVKGGYQRVSTNDLARMLTYWNVYEPTKGTGTPADCGGTVNP